MNKYWLTLLNRKVKKLRFKEVTFVEVLWSNIIVEGSI